MTAAHTTTGYSFPPTRCPGITAMHLDELGAIGVLHANTATITAALDQLPDR